MFRSQNFLVQEQHLHKEHTIDSDAYFKALKEVIDRHLRQFPDAMVSDILDYAVGKGENTEKSVRLIADIIDLLWLQYDDQNDPFTLEDWTYLRDLIDEYALELDMPLVQYVMERVVEHGGI